MVTPNHLRRFTIGIGERLDLGRVDQGARAGETADRAGSAMVAMLATSVALLVGGN
jgi:hypothetical protein